MTDNEEEEFEEDGEAVKHLEKDKLKYPDVVKANEKIEELEQIIAKAGLLEPKQAEVPAVTVPRELKVFWKDGKDLPHKAIFPAATKAARESKRISFLAQLIEGTYYVTKVDVE